MKRSIRAMLVVLALTFAACTATYTEADLQSEELREDADARAEEKRNRKIGDAGGANQMAIDEENAEVIESDL